MASGLLPRNPGPPSAGGSGDNFFASLTTGALIVNGSAVISNLTVNGGSTFNGVISGSAGILVDSIGTYTAGGDLLVGTTGTGKVNLNGSKFDTSGNLVIAGTSVTASGGSLTVGTLGGNTTVGGVIFNSRQVTNVDYIEGLYGKFDNLVPKTSGGDLTISTFVSGRVLINSAYFDVSGTLYVPYIGVTNSITAAVMSAPVGKFNSLSTVNNSGSISVTNDLALTVPLSVTSGGLGLASIALGAIYYGSAANTVSTLAGNTTATINYLSQTGTGSVSAAPVWQTPTQVKTGLSLNNVENTALSTWAGSTNLNTLGSVVTGTWSATPIGAIRGGTGQSSYTIGEMLVAAAGSTLTKITVNASTTPYYLSQSGNGATATTTAWQTPTQVKTGLSLNNVENTALSTWAGSSNITTLGAVSSCTSLSATGTVLSGNGVYQAAGAGTQTIVASGSNTPVVFGTVTVSSGTFATGDFTVTSGNTFKNTSGGTRNYDIGFGVGVLGNTGVVGAWISWSTNTANRYGYMQLPNTTGTTSALSGSARLQMANNATFQILLFYQAGTPSLTINFAQLTIGLSP